MIKLVKEPTIRDVAEVLAARLHDQIQQVLPYAAIEHIGSSAVPGSITKGDVDMQVEVVLERFTESVRILDGCFSHNPEMEPTDAFVSYSGSWDGTDFGIQLIRAGDTDFNFVQWREALKSSPQLLAQYNQLKQQYSGQGMEAYRQAKSEFIERALSEN